MNVFVLNTKEDILKTVGNGAVFLSYYGSQWWPKTAWLQTLFRTNTFMQVCHYLRLSKWWIFIFGWIILLFFLIVNIRQQGLSFTLQSYLWAYSLRRIRPPALMVFQGFCECARTGLWSMCHENEPNQLCFHRSDAVSRGSDAEHRDTWVPKEPALDAFPAGITSRWVCFFISP